MISPVTEPWPAAVVAVRTSVDPATLTKNISDIVLSRDPNLPLAKFKTMDQIKDESMAGDPFGAFLFGTFAGVTLLLADATQGGQSRMGGGSLVG